MTEGNEKSRLTPEDRPRPSGSVELSTQQLAPGEHLKMIHDYFRAEINQLVRIADAVAAEFAETKELADAIDNLSMRANSEQFGTFCGLACRKVTLHHRLEDTRMFPIIAELDLYAPLIAQLQKEHGVIHDHLDSLDAAAADFTEDETKFEALRRAIHTLRDSLFSHLAYEDEQLPEPMGVLDMPV